jgi:hypothetical protein
MIRLFVSWSEAYRREDGELRSAEHIELVEGFHYAVRQGVFLYA